MNINSIIEKILGNSIAGTKGDIELNDNSYLWNLVHKDPENEAANGEKFKISKKINRRLIISKNHRFPLTYFVYSFAILIGQLTIYGFYKIASFLKWLLTGRKCDLSQSPRFNLLVFIAACTGLIMLIVAILVFFIKSVLLFKPDTRVNEFGAITMPQSCDRENYMFLLSTATYWDNSGIKVLEGDEICISVSGSFFSDIDKMYKSALNNNEPEYGRTFVTFDKIGLQDPDSSIHANFLVTNIKNIKKDTDIKDTVFSNRNDPTFGSLLMVIRDASHHQPFHEENIITLNEIKDHTLTFIANNSGYLFFAVNDEYIDSLSFKLIQNSIELQHKLEIFNTAYKTDIFYDKLPSNIKDSLHAVKNGHYYYFSKADIKRIKRDTAFQQALGYTKDGLDTLATWDTWNEDLAKMWYSDNVGDILINVGVTRNAVQGNVFEPGILTKSYRWFEKFFLSPNFWHKEIWILLLVVAALIIWLLIDFFIGYFIRKYFNHTETQKIENNKHSLVSDEGVVIETEESEHAHSMVSSEVEVELDADAAAVGAGVVPVVETPNVVNPEDGEDVV